MKYVSQATIIFGFTLLGELLHALLPLPIPSAIYGLVLLFLALMLGIVKLHQVDGVSKFLIATMGILFVAPGVSILEYPLGGGDLPGVYGSCVCRLRLGDPGHDPEGGEAG